MNATMPLQLREPLGDERPLTPKKTRPTIRYIALFFAALAAVGLWVASSQRGWERRAVATIPAGERHLLYLRTLENLRFCESHATDGLKDYCEHEAAFIANFPECDGECRMLARGNWSGPRR